jgi:hypothetical protein
MFSHLFVLGTIQRTEMFDMFAYILWRMYWKSCVRSKVRLFTIYLCIEGPKKHVHFHFFTCIKIINKKSDENILTLTLSFTFILRARMKGEDVLMTFLFIIFMSVKKWKCTGAFGPSPYDSDKNRVLHGKNTVGESSNYHISLIRALNRIEPSVIVGSIPVKKCQILSDYNRILLQKNSIVIW